MEYKLQQSLYKRLINLRNQIAEEEHVLPYWIFTNKTIEDMCFLLPQTDEEFLSIDGIARVRLDNYSIRFKLAIKQFCNDFNIDIKSQPRIIPKEYNGDIVCSNLKELYSNFDKRLYNSLIELRNQIAEAEHKPVYYIFSNSTIAEMAYRMPISDEEFLEISGIGRVKLDNYCIRFKAIIIDYIQKNKLNRLSLLKERGVI